MESAHYKILYDAHVFLSQRAGGISRYHYELFKGLLQMGNNAQIAGKFIKNQYLISDHEAGNKFIYDPHALFALFNHWMLNYQVKRLPKNGIFHPSIPFAKIEDVFIHAPHKVLTIHDMILEMENPSILASRKQFVAYADKIIAVSQSTKDDIVSCYQVDPNKIDVIYHGSSLSGRNIQKPQQLLPEKYLFFVGERHSYKNFKFFIETIAPFLKKQDSLHVVCAGKKPFSSEETTLFEVLSINSQVHQVVQPKNEELAYLYAKSQAFIFPSLKEGFGIPILEAWSCKTPVILCDNKCFREVAEDGAVFFNPEQQASLLNCLEQVLFNSAYKKSIVEKGNERLKAFSWQKSVESHHKLYQSII